MKLNQVIAIVSGEKSKREAAITKAYHKLQRTDLFEGMTRRYSPLEDDPTGANKLPDEDKLVQENVPEVLADVRVDLEAMINMVATQDSGNTMARADITIDIDEDNSMTIAKDVPVTTLIFLEKQLKDIRTLVDKLPVLDPMEIWEHDKASGLYKSKEKSSIRTKKVPRNHIKAEATDKHPAQVEVYTEDAPIGTWTSVRFSGAISKDDRKAILERIEKLDKAVKVAREAANSEEVAKVETGDAILKYIFG